MTSQGQVPGEPVPGLGSGGRELLLVELGTVRERIEWVLAENVRLEQEVAEVIARASEQENLLRRTELRLANWRVGGAIAAGLAAIMGLLAFGALTQGAV